MQVPTNAELDKLEQDAIATAKLWTAYIQLAPREQYIKVAFTREEAFANARKLDKLSQYGREAVVYAVTPTGRQYHITRPEHESRYGKTTIINVA